MHQCTNLEALDEILSTKTITGYIGFDCTASSLHVGSLIQIMILRWFQKTGNKPIILLGGGTTKVGDPSGKDDSRKLLSDAQISENIKGIEQAFSKYLTFGDGSTDAIIINNEEWLDNIEYIPFLREFGQHFSVNRMLGFDSVRLRLEREQPLTFLEFNYMILQAYDFLELSRRHRCVLQIGGSDQWGNIVNGIELARRMDKTDLYGLTTPLLETASGTKMGKTANGATWMNADLLSPYDYWQFWRNTEDSDVGRFLRLFTDLPEKEISRLESLQGTEINSAKKILANETTTLCHGKEKSKQAESSAREVFEEGGFGENLPQVEERVINLHNGIPVCELFCKTSLVDSNSTARRLIRGGGGRINDIKIENERYLITKKDLDSNNYLKLSVGKKRHALIKFI